MVLEATDIAINAGLDDTSSKETAMNESIYYDPSSILGSPSPVNMTVGARGIGKTYGFLKAFTKAYLKTGAKFIYLRRYQTEIDDLMKVENGIIGGLVGNNEFPNKVLRVYGDWIQISDPPTYVDVKGRRVAKYSWETYGYIMALSTAQNRKGSEDKDIKYIFFDEFIREQKVPGYLPGEVNMLMNLWETYDRRESRVRIVMASNSVSIVNPYFEAWGIKDYAPGLYRYKRGRSSVTLEIPDSSKYKAAKRDSTISAFTEGTAYASYAGDNEFKDNTDYLIGKKTSRSHYMWAIKAMGKTYAIWMDVEGGCYYCCSKVPKDNAHPIAVILREDASPNTIMLERSDFHLKVLVKSLSRGNIFFESATMREEVMNILALVGYGCASRR